MKVKTKHHKELEWFDYKPEPEKKKWKFNGTYLWLILFSPIILLGLIAFGIFSAFEYIKDKLKC